MDSNLITRKQLATPIEKILFKRKKKKGLCSSTNVNVIKDKGCGIFPDAGRPEGPGGERGPWSSAGSRTRGRRAAKASVRQLAVLASDAGKSGGGGGLPWPRGSPPQSQRCAPGEARMRTTLSQELLIKNRARLREPSPVRSGRSEPASAVPASGDGRPDVPTPLPALRLLCEFAVMSL